MDPMKDEQDEDVKLTLEGIANIVRVETWAKRDKTIKAIGNYVLAVYYACLAYDKRDWIMILFATLAIYMAGWALWNCRAASRSAKVIASMEYVRSKFLESIHAETGSSREFAAFDQVRAALAETKRLLGVTSEKEDA